MHRFTYVGDLCYDEAICLEEAHFIGLRLNLGECDIYIDFGTRDTLVKDAKHHVV